MEGLFQPHLEVKKLANVMAIIVFVFVQKGEILDFLKKVAKKYTRTPCLFPKYMEGLFLNARVYVKVNKI